MSPNPAFRIAAATLFAGVALGALGAHALAERLGESGSATWKTAALYHLVHGLAALGVAALSRGLVRVPAAWWFFIVGIVLFSGSLYGLALGGPRWLGPITPAGGIAFLLGWAWLAAKPPRWGA